MFWIITIVIVVAMWLIFSIKIVGPDEMAVRVLFGEPVDVCDSGFCLVPFLPGLKCYLKRYPKKIYNLDYEKREVISLSGQHPVGGEKYGSQVLRVDAVAYLNFPREIDPELDIRKDDNSNVVKDKKGNPLYTHPLIKILRAGIPTEDEELKKWTDDAVVGALRIAFGLMTWKQAVEDMKSINEEVGKVFKDADGALIKAGFREPGIKIVVTEIILPKEIEEALPGPDKARLAADAAKDVAKQESIETAGTLIRMMSETTGLSSDDIQKAIQTSPAKFLRKYGQLINKNEDLLHRLMALNKNALMDIRVQGAEGLERMILNALAVWRKMSGGDNGKEEIKEEEGESEKEGETENVRSFWRKKHPMEKIHQLHPRKKRPKKKRRY